MVREHPLGKMAERTVGRIIAEQKGVLNALDWKVHLSQYLEGEAGQRLKQKIVGTMETHQRCQRKRAYGGIQCSHLQ